jgi:hypothetical protein
MRVSQAHSTSCLFSMASNTAEIQLVATSRDLLLDVQTTRVDVCGWPRAEHATAALSLAEAIRLELLLGDAITAAMAASDPRQTRLWSESPAPVRAIHRRRAA